MKHKSWLRCVAAGLASAAVGCVATGSRKPDDRVPPSPQPYKFLPASERQVSVYASPPKLHGRASRTPTEEFAIASPSTADVGVKGRETPNTNAPRSTVAAERTRPPNAIRMGRDPDSLPTLTAAVRQGEGLGARGLEAPGPVTNAANLDASKQAVRSPIVQVERATAEDVPIPTGTLIDLGAALRLAGVENPRINLARERITEAMADQLAARALLLPSLTAGVSVNLHNGPVQRTSTGGILDVNRQTVYFGAGAFAVGGSTVAIPGVRLFSPLADAIYEPLAARQIVSARRADAAAAENDILLRVVGAYLALVGAETRLEILRQGERDLGEIVRLTEAYARTGQGRVADARRAETNADLLRRQTQDTEGEVLATSARLAELLNLDPSERLRSPDGVIQPVSIIDDGTELESLIQQALANRPEVAARSAEVFESQTRVRQEQLRPLLPTLTVGFSAGGFGGGSPDRPDFYDIYRPRTDLDVMAVWSLQNLGVGTLARVGRNSAVVGQAVANLDLATNRIRQEVTDAVAGIRAANTQVEQARSAVKIATDGLAQEMRRIRQAEGLPLEVLDSFRQLLDSRLELNRAILAYDLSQFRLFVAVGSSPLLRADADPHGEAK